MLLIQKSKFDFTQLTAEGKKLPKEAKAPAPAPSGSTLMRSRPLENRSRSRSNIS